MPCNLFIYNIGPPPFSADFMYMKSMHGAEYVGSDQCKDCAVRLHGVHAVGLGQFNGCALSLGQCKDYAVVRKGCALSLDKCKDQFRLIQCINPPDLSNSISTPAAILNCKGQWVYPTIHVYRCHDICMCACTIC